MHNGNSADTMGDNIPMNGKRFGTWMSLPMLPGSGAGGASGGGLTGGAGSGGGLTGGAGSGFGSLSAALAASPAPFSDGADDSSPNVVRSLPGGAAGSRYGHGRVTRDLKGFLDRVPKRMVLAGAVDLISAIVTCVADRILNATHGYQ